MIGPSSGRIWGFPAAVLVLGSLLVFAGRYTATSYDIDDLRLLSRLARWFDYPVDPAVLQALLVSREPTAAGEASFNLLPEPDNYEITEHRHLICFPHFGDGRIPGTSQSFSTTLTFVNASTLTAEVKVEVLSDQGTTVTLPMEGRPPAGVYTISVPPLSVRELRSVGSGPVKSGWISVESNVAIGAAARFTNRTDKGVLVTSVGVAEGTLGRSFTIFADRQGGSNTGLALANPGNAPVRIEAELQSLAGAAVARRQIDLPPLGHRALFIDELFKGVAGIDKFVGRIALEADQEFAGTTLRVTGTQLTSMPFILDAGSADGSAPAMIPQVAHGSAAGLRIATSIILVNTGAEPVSGTIDFLDAEGNPLSFDFGKGNRPSYDFSLAGRGALRITSQGSTATRNGWARISPIPGLSTSSIFHIWDAQSRLITEMGVGEVPIATDFNLAADSLGSNNTGLALVNPDEEDPARLVFTLVDSEGSIIETKTETLQPLSQRSLFFTEIFPDRTDIDDFQGLVNVNTGVGVAAMTIWQEQGKLTSLPLLAPVRGFEPRAYTQLMQNLRGSAPPVRFRLEMSGMDLAMGRLDLSIQGARLNSTPLAENALIGSGLFLADLSLLGSSAIGATVDMVMIDPGQLTFAIRVTGGLGDPAYEILRGRFIGGASDDFRMEFSGGLPESFNWNRGISGQLDLFLAPGILQLPAQQSEVSVLTEYWSAPAKFGIPSSHIFRKSVQAIATSAPPQGVPRLHRAVPLFLVPGKTARIEGQGFTQSDRVIVPLTDETLVVVSPSEVRPESLTFPVPERIADGPVWVDNGTRLSNPLEAKVWFSPRFDVRTPAPAQGGKAVLELEVFHTDLQLASDSFQAKLEGASCACGGPAVGDSLGSAEIRVGTVVSRFNLAVVSRSADRLELEVREAPDKSPRALVVVESGPEGVKIGFQPSTPASRPNLFPPGSRILLRFEGLQLSWASPRSWLVRVDSVPGGPVAEGTTETVLLTGALIKEGL